MNERVAAVWQGRASAEGSVHAYAQRIVEDLRDADAAPRVLELAARMVSDEARHVAICIDVASRYAGRSLHQMSFRAAVPIALLALACHKPRSEAVTVAPPPSASASAQPVATGRWVEAGRLSMARGGFSLLPQPDGSVVAVGGVENGDDSRPSAYVDVYRNGAWSRGPDLPTPRKSASIVALNGGGALVLFGFANKGVVAGGERLDAKLTGWTAVKAPLTGSDLGITVLDDGRVLVAGGHDKSSECMGDSALFDPTKDAWTTLPKLPEPQVYGALIATTGKAYLVGGLCDNTYYPLRVLDPASSSWSNGAPGPVERIGGRVTRLRDGRILVSGGEPSKYAVDTEGVQRLAVFDPKSSQWHRGPATKGPRSSHGTTVLADGRVMLAGGEDRSFHEIDSVEIYDPANDTIVEDAPLPRALMHPQLVALADGRVLAVGGWVNTPGRYVGDAWIWSR